MLKEKQAKLICILLIVGLWSGHLWRYPEKLSVSWDTTLSHLPYYDLRKDMLQYIDDNHIDYREIASFFPASASGREIDLSNDRRRFSKSDSRENKYAIYSNIANWRDDDIMKTRHWTLLKEFRRYNVFIRIYELVEPQ
ncbi:MAG: hypothetical protein LBC40_01730 [Dysgonamonadaceae bacterium]|nr:hypothetical protein [Dysgonamonadaceae bacterium]